MRDIVKSYDITEKDGRIWSHIIVERTCGEVDAQYRARVVDVFASGFGSSPEECVLNIASALEHQAKLIRESINSKYIP